MGPGFLGAGIQQSSRVVKPQGFAQRFTLGSRLTLAPSSCFLGSMGMAGLGFWVGSTTRVPRVFKY